MEPGNKTAVFLPVAALLVGVVGLVVGVVAWSKAGKAETAAAAAGAGVTERIDQVEESIRTSAEGYAKVADLVRLRDSVQAAINDIGNQGKSTRDEVAKLSEAIRNLQSVPVAAIASADGPGGSGGPAAPTIPPGTLSEDGTYAIKRGDTLSGLARQFGVKLADITAANPGIDPNKLQVGQKIRIPGAPAPAPAP